MKKKNWKGRMKPLPIRKVIKWKDGADLINKVPLSVDISKHNKPLAKMIQTKVEFPIKKIIKGKTYSTIKQMK